MEHSFHVYCYPLHSINFFPFFDKLSFYLAFRSAEFVTSAYCEHGIDTRKHLCSSLYQELGVKADASLAGFLA